MTSLDTLATYYVQLARREKSKETRKDYFAQVAKYDVLYTVYIDVHVRRSFCQEKKFCQFQRQLSLAKFYHANFLSSVKDCIEDMYMYGDLYRIGESFVCKILCKYKGTCS